MLLSATDVAVNKLLNNLALMQIIAGLAPLKQIREVPVCLSVCPPARLSVTLVMTGLLKAGAAQGTGRYADGRSLQFAVIMGDGWLCHVAVT